MPSPRRATAAAAFAALLACCSASSATSAAAGGPSPGPAVRAAASDRTPDDAWLAALPGYRFSFPADYGAHERFRNEWWYYTGNLRDGRGRRFGFEETIFRYGVQHPIAGGSAWDIDDLYFAHFALTDVDGRRFVFSDRTGRAALGAAGASTGDERAWVGGWRVERMRSGAHLLEASMPAVAIDLRLEPEIGATVHGVAGISRKGPCATCASHYYSFVRMRASGTLRSGGATRAVSGRAWNDHEWGSDELAPGVAGWDWFAIQLDGGPDVMLYRLRRTDGSTVPQSSGTLVRTDGSARHLASSDFSIAATGTWVSPHDGARYPSGWRVALPREHLVLQVVPLLADQELTTAQSTRVSYWEGACEIRGSLAGRSVHGYGYTELTGYAPGGLGSLR